MTDDGKCKMQSAKCKVHSAKGRYRWTVLVTLLCLIFLPVASAHAQSKMGAVSPARVLVVANTRSPDSLAIAKYYALKRGLPEVNICYIACAPVDECSMLEYMSEIREP